MFVVAVSILQYHLLCASSLVTRCDWCCGCQAGLFAMLLAVEAVIVWKTVGRPEQWENSGRTNQSSLSIPSVIGAEIVSSLPWEKTRYVGSTRRQWSTTMALCWSYARLVVHYSACSFHLVVAVVALMVEIKSKFLQHRWGRLYRWSMLLSPDGSHSCSLKSRCLFLCGHCATQPRTRPRQNSTDSLTCVYLPSTSS